MKQSGPRRASRRLASGIAVGVVLAIVAVLVVAKAVSHSTPASSASSAPAAVVHAATAVPGSAFDAVGVPAGLNPPKALPGSTPPLTSRGLPRILYVGAEYCPYCAAERWAMVAALSRFGAFSGLGATESSTTDVFPGTKTFTFYGSTYHSKYVVFSSVEMQTNKPASGGGYRQLQQLTAEQQRLLDEFDRAPYAASSGGIPFTDIGNRFIMVGAAFDPGVLQGLTMVQIASRLADPSSEVGRAVLGGANLLTAAICEDTGGRPGAVCSSPAVVRARSSLGVTG